MLEQQRHGAKQLKRLSKQLARQEALAEHTARQRQQEVQHAFEWQQSMMRHIQHLEMRLEQTHGMVTSFTSGWTTQSENRAGGGRGGTGSKGPSSGPASGCRGPP